MRSYAGVTVRAIPLGGEGYASGLVAADAVSDEVLTRVRQALTAAWVAAVVPRPHAPLRADRQGKRTAQW